MVKKKGKSKRTTLKDKYKIKRRIVETHRSRRKQAKRDVANGIVRHDKKNKDPGIPNAWPFKQDLLKEIQRSRERQQQLEKETKERRKSELKSLREHQAGGGTARTVQEMMEMASRARSDFEEFQGAVGAETKKEKSDGTPVSGQSSRRAYLRDLKKLVDQSDVLLQVLDARDPIGSRIHSSVENAMLSRVDKRMVLVLNKIDLVPKDVVGAWLTTLRRSHPAIAIKACQDRSSCHGAAGGACDDASSSTTPVGMEGLLQLLKNYARTGGSGEKKKNKTTIVVGVLGYPNVGKSSIINAFKRARAVGVSPRPGFTTSLQEVVLDKNVRLIDSPGIVFDDKSTLLGNCVDAESIPDPIPPVAALLERCNHASLLMTYNIPSFPRGDVMMFLSMVARSYGRVLKGGIPDKVSAARAVLKDWNQGKIPYFTAPPADALPEVAQDAVVVSQFGSELDLEALDRKVMSSLNDTDEMDFVKMEEGTNWMSEGTSKRVTSALSGNCAMEDDADDDDSSGRGDGEDNDNDAEMDED